MNDSLTEFTTPYTFKALLPGDYEITFGHPGCRSKSKNAAVESALTKIVSVNLQDTLAWLDYNIYNSAIPNNFISKIDIDDSGTLWMVASEYGLISFKDDTWTTYTLQNSPISELTFVSDLLVDKNNTLWVGAYEGLYANRSGDWELYCTDNSGLLNNSVTCLSLDTENTLWLGTKQGVYSRTSNGSWSSQLRYKNENNNIVDIKNVSCLIHDSSGNIWIGMNLKEFICLAKNGDNYEISYHQQGLASRNTCIVEEEDEGRIWFGFHGNQPMMIFNLSSEEFYDAKIWQPTFFINDLYYDSQNNVWICTESGLEKWKNKYSAFFSGIDVKSIAEDQKNNIMWVATFESGLIKLKEY